MFGLIFLRCLLSEDLKLKVFNFSAEETRHGDSKVRSKEWASLISGVQWLYLVPHPHFLFPFLGEVSLIPSLVLYLSKALLEPTLCHPHRVLQQGATQPWEVVSRHKPAPHSDCEWGIITMCATTLASATDRGCQCSGKALAEDGIVVFYTLCTFVH